MNKQGSFMQYKRWFIWCLGGMMACATLSAREYTLSDSCKRDIGRIMQQQLFQHIKTQMVKNRMADENTICEETINELLESFPIGMEYFEAANDNTLFSTEYFGGTLQDIAEGFVPVFSDHLQQHVNGAQQHWPQMDSEKFLINTLPRSVRDVCMGISFYVVRAQDLKERLLLPLPRLDLKLYSKNYIHKMLVAIYYDWISSDGDFSDTLSLKLQWLLRVYFREPNRALDTLKKSCKGKNGYAIEAALKTLLKEELEKNTLKGVNHQCPWLNNSDSTECKQCCYQQWVRIIAQAMIAEAVHKKQLKNIVFPDQATTQSEGKSDDKKIRSKKQKVKRGSNDHLDIQPHYHWILIQLCKLLVANAGGKHSIPFFPLYDRLLYYKAFDTASIKQELENRFHALHLDVEDAAWPMSDHLCKIIEDWYATGIRLGYIQENTANQPSKNSVVDHLKNTDKRMSMQKP